MLSLSSDFFKHLQFHKGTGYALPTLFSGLKSCIASPITWTSHLCCYCAITSQTKVRNLFSTCVTALTNLALGKQTYQSSAWVDGNGQYTSNLAVDGNTNSKAVSTPITCSITMTEDFNTWWAVDLGTAYYVQGVLMINRGDNSYGEYRLPIHS